jgi:hypothetical protein
MSIFKSRIIHPNNNYTESNAREKNSSISSGHTHTKKTKKRKKQLNHQQAHTHKKKTKKRHSHTHTQKPKSTGQLRGSEKN